MADELVEVLEKQAHICRTSKTIGLITKARSADAMQRASARIQSDAAEIARLRGELADARVKALEEAAKRVLDIVEPGHWPTSTMRLVAEQIRREREAWEAGRP